jgi:hypothetical protein
MLANGASKSEKNITYRQINIATHFLHNADKNNNNTTIPIKAAQNTCK